jgi:hypothetical protein
LEFYTECLGFDVMYVRGAPDFAMLRLGRVRLMLAQLDDQVWLTGPMVRPFGRGINLEMEHADPIGDGNSTTQSEFLVQDPDGYLLRFASA